MRLLRSSAAAVTAVLLAACDPGWGQDAAGEEPVHCDDVTVETDVPAAADTGFAGRDPADPSPREDADDDAPAWEYVETLPDDVRAGSYLDRSSGVRVFLFTRDTGHHVERIRERSPRPEQVAGATVEHSLAELEEVYDDEPDDPRLASRGLVVSLNRVRVGVEDPDDPALRDLVADRYPLERICIHEADEESFSG